MVVGEWNKVEKDVAEMDPVLCVFSRGAAVRVWCEGVLAVSIYICMRKWKEVSVSKKHVTWKKKKLERERERKKKEEKGRSRTGRITQDMAVVLESQ